MVNSVQELSCKLTSPELQKRKATILTGLRNKILEKKELSNGFAYKFPGDDGMLDELIEFIKTERICCEFFQFKLIVEGDGIGILLELTGPDKAKDFITSELEL